MIQAATEKGDWNFELPKIYTLALLNFNLKVFANDPNYKHVVRLTDLRTHQVVYHKLTYLYLEMKKFKKEIDLGGLRIDELEDSEAMVDLWIYLLNNLDKFEQMPQAFRDSLFEQFFREA